ncbi:hypothetical protein BGX29_003456, partial [Mortierella sp. GBA35]
KHLTWKTYQEDMPDVCAAQSEVSGLYFQKHNPFVVHQSIAKNSTRCKNVVPATQLSADLAAAAASTAATTDTSGGASSQLPNYMYYTPNMINDGHNTTVRDATKWLSTFLPSLLSNPAYQASNTLLVITFDETEDYFIQDNLVYTLLLGSSDSVIPAALKNTTDNTFYTHYSLLSTVEENWGLGNLGRNDANKELANVFYIVANKTEYKNVQVASVPVFNETIPGFLTSAPHVSSSYSPSHANSQFTSSPSLAVAFITLLVSIIGFTLV